MKKQAVINKVSSPRDVVGDLLLTWPYYKKDFSLYNITTQSAEDSPQRHWGMTSFFNKKAFTLIELLVVVLIIGILAAIALPQYEKAVLKTRFATIKALTRALADAEEAYYLANGEYTTQWDNLDVTTPPYIEEFEEGSGVKRTFSWGSCALWSAGGGSVGCRYKEQLDFGIRYKNRDLDLLPKEYICTAYNTDLTSPENSICKTESGNSEPDKIGTGYTYWFY